ncbi:MAG: nucleoside triphosphate pyrophosphohydrolase family protein, partial [Terriglobia bacterium]
MKPQHRSTILADYVRQVEATDQLPLDDIQPVLLGLFGEIGSLMATAKKLHREREVYRGYGYTIEEEFGDALWYFTALCRRLNVRVDQVLGEAARQKGHAGLAAVNDLSDHAPSHVSAPLVAVELDSALPQLGKAAADLFVFRNSPAHARGALTAFADRYLRALSAAHVNFANVVRKNVAKTRGRFLQPDFKTLPTFDRDFPEDEQLPAHFVISINQRPGGHSYLRMNGVFIGDPLTDNIL